MVVLIGIAAALGALVVQGVAGALGAGAVDWLLVRRMAGTHVWNNGLATLALIAILLAGHFVQMGIWAMVFLAAGEFAKFAIAFYHSAVNYTTLGYGDIVMSPHWRMLGPLEAATGMLAFGWSTAVIVTAAIRLARVRHRAQLRRDRR